MSKCLDPDQGRRFVGPDLVTNCLQRLSANVESRHDQGKSQIRLSSSSQCDI